jgi:hypothetical protein
MQRSSLDSGPALFRVSMAPASRLSDFGHVVTRVRVAVEISPYRPPTRF